MIKAIAFDLGGVLYTYNNKKLMQEVSKELNISIKKTDTAWKKGIIKFEEGNISEQEFWKVFLNSLNKSYDTKILHNLVIGHFKPIKENLKIINGLKSKFFLGMITNQTSWIYELNKKYHFRRLFDIVIASNEVSLRKPKSKIFKLFIKKSKLKPEEIVFIDDTNGYKKSVEKTGIKFIHYKNPKDLKKKLNKLK